MSPKGHPSTQTRQTASPPNSDGTASKEEVTWPRGHSSKKPFDLLGLKGALSGRNNPCFVPSV